MKNNFAVVCFCLVACANQSVLEVPMAAGVRPAVPTGEVQRACKDRGAECERLCLQRAAAEACTIMRGFYAGIHGGRRDAAKEFTFTEKACLSGGGGMCSWAADMLEHGQGTAKNPRRQLELLDLGCKLEDSSSCIGAAGFIEYDSPGRTGALAAEARRRVDEYLARGDAFDAVENEVRQFSYLGWACDPTKPERSADCARYVARESKVVDGDPQYSAEQRKKMRIALISYSCKLVPRSTCDDGLDDDYRFTCPRPAHCPPEPAPAHHCDQEDGNCANTDNQ